MRHANTLSIRGECLRFPVRSARMGVLRRTATSAGATGSKGRASHQQSVIQICIIGRYQRQCLIPKSVQFVAAMSGAVNAGAHGERSYQRDFPAKLNGWVARKSGAGRRIGGGVAAKAVLSQSREWAGMTSGPDWGRRAGTHTGTCQDRFLVRPQPCFRRGLWSCDQRQQTFPPSTRHSPAQRS